jgi:hypothetical protein
MAAPARSEQRTEQRAEQRAPIRRRRNSQAMTDRYFVDKAKVPEGMDYEWKRASYGGLEDREHQIALAEYGAWTPVPAERHPELFGPGAKKGDVIVRGANVLMERPKELTEEARAEDAATAADQVSTQVKRLGLSTHKDMPRQKNQQKLKHEFATGVEVPADEDEETE